jgi:integrase
MRTVLSAALTRAVREELISRNVARLVELPEWHAGTVRPWTAEEARQFLAVSEPDPLHAAFVLLILYGLRRGEVLGLRWQDIDFGAEAIRIEQQVLRVGGEMHVGPVKTRAGKHNLPLLKLAREALAAQSITQARYRAAIGSAWPDTDLVFTTRTGRPIEPRNLVRSFRRICEANNVRLIKLHHIRHTVASLLELVTRQCALRRRDLYVYRRLHDFSRLRTSTAPSRANRPQDQIPECVGLRGWRTGVTAWSPQPRSSP